MKKVAGLISVLCMFCSICFSANAGEANLYLPEEQSSDSIAVCVDTFYFLPEEIDINDFECEDSEEMQLIAIGKRYAYYFLRFSPQNEESLLVAEKKIKALPFVYKTGKDAYDLYLQICKSGIAGDSIDVQIKEEASGKEYLLSDFNDPSVECVRKLEIDDITVYRLYTVVPSEETVLKVKDSVEKFDFVEKTEICQVSSYLHNSFIYGDLNNDGKVTADEARSILRVSVGIDSIEGGKKIVCDMDKDNGISAADARLALRTSVGLEEILKGKFPV